MKVEPIMKSSWNKTCLNWQKKGEFELNQIHLSQYLCVNSSIPLVVGRAIARKAPIMD
ncbi:hypothetical protein [Cytobacillus praedii]|uniref:hypothetical protein n=2 Tax=Cytobacillus praedii TaxID=1742358 RepID=UPI003F7E18FA